ncbi:hypothetical protein [Streptomyces hirsutus]|uniref:hypothetical protein n=1 Tax=Streptomyces hirsutus TaxID=35620 RepID=UPI0006E2E35D|nr:hypothetical protein [Streptomyces hirsutus]
MKAPVRGPAHRPGPGVEAVDALAASPVAVDAEAGHIPRAYGVDQSGICWQVARSLHVSRAMCFRRL